MDTENVQPDVVSEETPSPEVETPSEEKRPEEQPLTKEEVMRLIAEGTERAKELGRREMQGIKDREVAQALQRARFAEETLASTEAGYRELDPQGAEVARLKGYERAYQEDRQRQQIEQQVAASKQVFYDGMTQSITEMGIDPYDKRMDWATDAPDPNTAQRRILASAGKILNEDRKAEVTRLRQELKDEMQQFRKDQGLDSHDTTTSPGVVGSDAEFVKKFGIGDLPVTQANIDRYKKITSSY